MKKKISLDYVESSPLLIVDAKNIHLSLIGCGGTGSWLAPAIVRIAKILQERYEKKVEVIFYDPDQVEEKNIYRQNFCSAEIGSNKAETLAIRYGLAWGVEVISVPKPFSASWPSDRDLYIYIGCVDGYAGRKTIDSISSMNREILNAWWLDCGNDRDSGQVLLGSLRKRTRKSEDHFNPLHLGLITWLPKPSLQHPELLKPLELQTEEDVAHLSCAEIAMLDSQGLAINQRVAAEAADYLVRMLITHDLRKYATYIDLSAGSCQSKYCVLNEIESWWQK